MTRQAVLRSVSQHPAVSSLALPSHLEALIRQLVAREVGRPTARVTALVGDCYHVFCAHTICRFSAANKYVCFTWRDQEYVMEESLSALAARLAPAGFHQVHRGELVNLDKVRRIHRAGRGLELELEDRQLVRVSRRLTGEVFAALRGVGRAAPRAGTAAPRRRRLAAAGLDR